MSGMEIHRVGKSWQESSKDVWGKIETVDPYQKWLGSVDERTDVIDKLGWMWPE